VLFAWRKPDYVAGPDLLDGAAPTLRTSTAEGDDQRLTERMRMPCGARAGLEGDACAPRRRWLWRIKEHIDTHSAGKILRRSFA